MRNATSLIVRGSLAVLCAASLSAQCAESQFGTLLGTGDDVVFTIQPLGITFPFNGTTYTDVHVCTNGFVYLSNGGSPAPGGPLCCVGSPTTMAAAAGPIVAPFWSDHVIDSSGSVWLNNTLPGKAVVTWKDAREYLGTARYTFQLQLSVTGDITFAYDDRCTVTTTGDLLVGMSEGAGAVIPLVSDFSAVGVSTTTMNYELFNILGLTFDLAGQSVLFLATPPGYTWIPQPCPMATNAPYGVGCYAELTSFYEYFPTSALDLANTAMSMVPTGGGYLVTAGLTSFVPPSPSASVLVLGDDTAQPVNLTGTFNYPGGSTTQLVVCSNGFVSASAGNITGYFPTIATMLNQPAAAWWCWHDFNPAAAGSGQVKFEQIGSVAYVTFDGVYSFNFTQPETMQFQFDLASGSVHMIWGAMGGVGGTYLVGYSPGGPASVDPGSRDLSVYVPAGFLTFGADQQLPLVLQASPLPTPGSTVTFTVSNTPEFSPGSGLYAALHILSYSPLPAPGVDLGFFGAPGCPLLVATLDVTSTLIGLSPTLSVSFPVPIGTPIGAGAASQAIALFPPFGLPNGQNAAGLSTSNAILSIVGAW